MNDTGCTRSTATRSCAAALEARTRRDGFGAECADPEAEDKGDCRPAKADAADHGAAAADRTAAEGAGAVPERERHRDGARRDREAGAAGAAGSVAEPADGAAEHDGQPEVAEDAAAAGEQAVLLGGAPVPRAAAGA